MSFYSFRFDSLQVLNTRDVRLDTDVVTFTVLVNQIDRGHAAGVFPSLAKGSLIPSSAISTRNRLNAAGWTVGPFEIAPGDLISIISTGTNTSDADNITLDTAAQDKIELFVLGEIASLGIGAVGGAIGTVLGTIFNIVADPIATILGFEPHGPCNGVVFASSRDFTGDGLDRVPMGPVVGSSNPGIVFKSDVLTDAATHNSDRCNADVAASVVTIQIFREPFISVKTLRALRFPNDFDEPLRRAGAGGKASLKARLGISL